MRRRIEKDDWSYIYEDTQKCIYEFTSVRYILGRKIDKSKTKALICIGINPSTAIPTLLDPTLSRVQKYAQNSGEYNAWYETSAKLIVQNLLISSYFCTFIV